MHHHAGLLRNNDFQFHGARGVSGNFLFSDDTFTSVWHCLVIFSVSTTLDGLYHSASMGKTNEDDIYTEIVRLVIVNLQL